MVDESTSYYIIIHSCEERRCEWTGVQRSGGEDLPPRQAGFTSFSTKKSNCNLLEDVASPHCAKTSLSSTLRIISSKEDGSPCLVIADEDLTLDFEAGTPGTSNHGAGVRCFISAHEKIFRIDL